MRRPRVHFEQIPVSKVKEMIVGIEMHEGAAIVPGIQSILHCRMCRQPVAIETAKTDWDGQAIHEDCYVLSLSRKPTHAKNRRTQPLL